MSTQKSDLTKYIAAGAIVAASLGYLGYKKFFRAKAKALKGDTEELKMFVDQHHDTIVELSRDDGEKRSEIVSNVHYDLVLSFFEHEQEFEGYIRITFDLSQISNDAFLNFEGKSLSFVRINDQEVPLDKEVFIDHKINLPKDMIKVGKNVVDVRYTGLYRRDGVGLHRYEDPEDGEMYLYTLFESFSANKCFPCFDQPDIKATMQFSSFCPSKWTVITNELEENVVKAKSVYEKILDKIGCDAEVSSRLDQETLVFKQFNTTKKISSYLFAFVVGPYAFERNNVEGYEQHVPMRIFARKSMMKYVNHEEFFKITMAGMSYYKEFFGTEYPFSKYDQIYCPEFNCGAMENVGCVTYTEHYLDREDVVPMSKRHQRAITILHELSHQWFGNLVTMKWWDDLWLNESFATIMSHISLDDAEGLEEYKFSWDVFSKYKEWGLNTDEYESTHPVAADVKDTEDAENIFDGISYAKGASIMKQLIFYISEEVFIKGVQKYFAKYAYQNTQLVDLIGTLQSACEEAGLKVDLFKWCDSWIKTSGFNIIDSAVTQTENESGEGIIEKFTLRQELSKNGENELRSQNFRVCFFDEQFDISSVHNLTIDAEKETHIQELVGEKMPTAYLLNYEDWGYGKFIIDDYSLEAFKLGLSKIKDDLTRKLIYNTITIMTKDGRLSANTFFEIVKNHIASETNQSIVSGIITYSVPAILRTYVPKEYYQEESDSMFNFLLNTLLPLQSDSETRQIVISAIVSVSSTDDHFLILKDWVLDQQPSYFKNSAKVHVDAKLSVDNKHTIFKKLATSMKLNNEENMKFIQEQLDADTENKDMNARTKLSCEAAKYDKDSKFKFMDALMADKSQYSIWEARAIMSTLMPSSQMDIVEPLIDRFFSDIHNVFRTKLRDERDAIYHGLSPLRFASPEILEKYQKLISSLGDDPKNKSLLKMLKEDVMTIEKSLKGKELYLKTVQE